MKEGLDISVSTIIYIFIVGIIGSVTITMIFYTITMYFTTLTASSLLENEAMYLLIFTVLELLTFLSSLLISIAMRNFQQEKIPTILILLSSISAFGIHFVLLIIITYSSLYFLYPDLLAKVFFALPSVFAYFSIYVLNHSFGIVFLSLFIFFGCFAFMLNYFN